MRAVLRHYQAGHLPQAAAVLRQIVEDNPSNPDALHLLGAVLAQMNDPQKAIPLITRAIELKPAAPFFETLGRVQKSLGQFALAIASYTRAIELNPNFAEAENNLGVALRASARLEDATTAFREAIRLSPDFPEAHNNLANALLVAGKFEQSAIHSRRALSLKPDYAQALANLGIAQRELGELTESLISLRHSLRLHPDDPETQNNLANTLRSLGRLPESIAAYTRAIELNPNFPQAHNNLAVALWESGNFNGSIAAATRALELTPDFPQAHNTLANALRDTGDLDSAETHYRRAIELEPHYAEAHANLAVVLKDQARLDEAITSARRSIEIRPNHAAHSNLIYLLHFHPDHHPVTILEEQKTWQRIHALTPLTLLIPSPGTPGEGQGEGLTRRLRIGYTSPNFNNHVVGLNLLPLLREHDHRRFEIFCYHDSPRTDSISEKFWAYADQWRTTANLTDDSLAAQIRADKIDILIDLSLHLSSNRLLTFAAKPAPIQASFAGYPSGTGLNAMDYRLTDLQLDPLDSKSPHYIETPIRLASFWCYDELAMTLNCDPRINALPAIETGQITFGSLNNFCKLNDQVTTLWSRLLQKVQNSRLLILAPRGSARTRLLAKFESQGINPTRINFANQAPRPDYLRLYHQIDITLDTFPYNGHTTSLDSLFMGVPVITLPGNSPVSRAGASHLTNLALPELIAKSPDDYINIATQLAQNLPHLSHLRQSLREKMRRSNLMNPRAFTQDIESAYKTMWAAHPQNA